MPLFTQPRRHHTCNNKQRNAFTLAWIRLLSFKQLQVVMKGAVDPREYGHMHTQGGQRRGPQKRMEWRQGWKTLWNGIPTGNCSTNYKTEAEDVQTAAQMLHDNRQKIHNSHHLYQCSVCLVFFSNSGNEELNVIASATSSLQHSTEQTICLWIPSQRQVTD